MTFASRSRARRRCLLTIERLGHEVADRVLRVERLVRVLEDQLDPPPVGAQRLRRPTARRRPARRTRSVPPVCLVSLTIDPAGRRLAAARLADERQDLAPARASGRCRRRPGRRRAAVRGSESMQAAADREVDLEALEAEQLARRRPASVTAGRPAAAGRRRRRRAAVLVRRSRRAAIDLGAAPAAGLAGHRRVARSGRGGRRPGRRRRT